MGRTRKIRKGGNFKNKQGLKAAKPSSTSDKLAKRADKLKTAKKEATRQSKQRSNDTVTVAPADVIDTCGDPTQSMLMNYHLWADMIHDHGNSLLDIANPLFGPRSPGLKSNEDEVVSMFKSSFPALQNNVRIKNTLRFSVENKTELFPSQGPAAFVPFVDTLNSNIGVLQDAGFLLFRAMGAQNIITFGSVLDQAGKPSNKNDNPLAYIPEANIALDIRPCTYGFNEAAVQNIRIGRFIGGMSATCKFNYRYKATPYIGGTPDEGLQINKLGGDFKSIAEIAAAGPEKDKFSGYIGKALGDISLVASLQQNIGATANPYYPAGMELTYIKEPARTPKPVVTKLILNTGDRLNHIRAYAFGVGSVYSSSAGGFRTFEYIPGVVTGESPLEQVTLYQTRMKLLIDTIDRTYEGLIEHIKSIIASGNLSAHSLKSGLPLISDASKFDRGFRMLNNIIVILETFRTYILYHFISKYNPYEVKVSHSATEPLTNTDVENIKNDYEGLLKIVDTVRPTAVSTKNTSGRDVLNIIPITKTTKLDIFEFEISNAAGVQDGSISKPLLDAYMTRIRGDRIPNDIPAFPVRPAGEMKGSQTFYITNIYQLIGKGSRIGEPYSNIFNTFTFGGSALPDIISGGAVGGQISIELFAQVFVPPTKELPAVLEPAIPNEVDIDILNDYRASGLTASVAFNAYNTYKEYPPSIIDPQLLQQVLIAYYNAVGADGETDLNYLFEKKADYSDAISSIDSLKFNVWSCYYNAHIARSRDEYDTPEDNELSNFLIYSAEQLRSLYGENIPTPMIGYVDTPVDEIETSDMEAESAVTMGAPGDEPGPAPVAPVKPSTGTFAAPGLLVHAGGQRVERENPSIDLTKSLVQILDGGASPS